MTGSAGGNRIGWIPCVANAVACLVMSVAIGGRSGADDRILKPTLSTIFLPDAGGRVLGFTSQVRIASDSAAGYVAVEITFKANGTLSADRRLVYRFETSPDGQVPPRNGLTIDVPIDVPQGTTTETFIRYLPKWSAGQAVEVSVLEDGRVLEDYIGYAGRGLRRDRRATRALLASEHRINWVFISPEDKASANTMPDLRVPLSATWSNPENLLSTGPLIDSQSMLLMAQVMSGPNVLGLGQKELPVDWRGYQRYDVIAVDMKGLERLKDNDAAMQAVRQWVLNGGTVILYDAPSPELALDSLDFGWTGQSDPSTPLETVVRQFLWQIKTSEEDLKESISRLEGRVAEYQQLQKTSDLTGSSADVSALLFSNLNDAKSDLIRAQEELAQYAKVPRYSRSEWLQQVWMQPTGAGNVLGIKKSDQYTVPPLWHWKIAMATIGYRASPMLRRGVDPLLGDRRFSKWMIPGVAQPPVYTFMGLLTAFVVLVGPVAYRRTSKYGRSYLMFAIAPALALFTTLAMFGYGIVSDGFGTVVRARQLTWVDGKSGDAGERTRTTYFAGVRPGDGLRFPGNAEVIGYPEGTGKPWEELNELTPATIGKVVIRDQSQRFDSSFLPSRQQRQFVVHEPRRNVGHLRLMLDPKKIASARVENGFDFAVHQAVMRDRRGNYWFVENLDAGQQQDCQPLLSKDASKALGKIYNDHRPLSTLREKRRNVAYDNRVYDVIMDANRQLQGNAVVTEGIFEHWLQQHLQTMGEIPQDHFVATADVSPDVLAVKDSELVASIRYVFGTLR